jgi:hypothetical protein
MAAMNARFLLVLVLNAIVAVALAALLLVLLTRGPRPDDAGRSVAPVSPIEGVSEQAPAQLPRSRSGPPPGLTEQEVELIRRDLTEHPELIPFEGRLGGTMDFYDPSSIVVLSDRWVYARFDDGHVQGEMMLEYELTETGDIVWEVLQARLQ